MEKVGSETDHLFVTGFTSYFDGYKILHFTDFHLGTFPKDTDFVEKVVECANNEDVELMAFTGDLVNNSATEVAPYLETLKQLHAPDGIYSVWEIMIIVSMITIIPLEL